MGHWNTQFSGHFLITEEDQGHQRGQQPEPSSLYGNVSNVHHPNIRSSIPPPNNFSFPRMPDHRDNAFFHSMAHQYRGFPPQSGQADIDLSIPQSSAQYIPYTTAGDSSVQVHGTSEQLSLSNPHYSGPRENFPVITSLLDNDPHKRKSLEMALPLFPFHSSHGGPSSSANPSTSAQVEFNDAQNAPFPAPYEHYANGPSPLVEGERSRSVMSRHDTVGQEDFIPYSADPIVQGSSSLGPSSVPYQGNPWSDPQFGASNGDVAGTYLWPPAPSFPYMTASPNGARVEAGNIGLQQGYQLRNPYGFIHPAFPHVSPYLPMQGSMGYGVTYPLQPGTSAQSIPTTGSSWNGRIGPYQNNMDASPMFVPPPTAPPPAGVQLFGHRRGDPPAHGANPRYRFPSLRPFYDDEAAIPEATSSHETGSSDDQHNDMRMDIDDMSYEELLALEEEIGQVATGLSEDFIERNLRSRTITLSEIGIDLEDIPSPDHQINLCTVCQNEYEGGDTIGSLECGHEYHRACIKQWLVLRNTCPICKATALSNNL